jgi:Multicopper oxidase
MRTQHRCLPPALLVVALADCTAKCWSYKGSTSGLTIEAVEGDRVRILATNRLGKHTSMHWHGILLPAGMDGVGGSRRRTSRWGILAPGSTRTPDTCADRRTRCR